MTASPRSAAQHRAALCYHREVMSPDSAVRKLTYVDFLGFPEDGMRHELIDGEHVAEPSPNTIHQRISSNLHRILSSFVHRHRLGLVLAAPCDVVLSDVDVLEPDLLFVAAAHADRITRPFVKGPPDLVIEILSGSTRRRDEEAKRDLYQRHGVAEYWIVDPELETVKVYRRAGVSFQRVAELSVESGGQLVSPLFEGLEIAPSEIFE
jgi:Uma2 family endonuclease